MLALSVLALVVPPVSGAAAASSSQVRLTSSQQAGLRALPRDVDQAVVRMEGRQTALNEVTSADGDAVLTLPVPVGLEFLDGAAPGSVQGATATRTTTRVAAKTAAATSGFHYACPWNQNAASGRWLCLYQDTHDNGLSESATSVGSSARVLRFHDSGYQALHPYDFENRPSSIVNTTFYQWYVYDWTGGNPNCGSGDSHGAAKTVTNASFEVYAAYATIGTLNDKADCIRRL